MSQMGFGMSAACPVRGCPRKRLFAGEGVIQAPRRRVHVRLRRIAPRDADLHLKSALLTAKPSRLARPRALRIGILTDGSLFYAILTGAVVRPPAQAIDWR